MTTRPRARIRCVARGLGLAVGAVLVLGGCGFVTVEVDRSESVHGGAASPSDEPFGSGEPAAAESPTAAQPSEPPEPSESDVRPMEVGDCLEKVGLDEVGKPIPEYVDCDEPHKFEVTGLFTHSSTTGELDAESLEAEIKATCRGAYESYTGRDSRAVGNAFGWDPPSEAAWDADDHSYACYATAPMFGDLVGSVAFAR